MNQTSIPRSELDLPLVVTSLMKGVVYRDNQDKTWWHLLALQPQVRDYVATIGLMVVVDEAEGYAFLRSRQEADDEEPSTTRRLVARRALSFHVSLLLALLRKRLAQCDADTSDSRLILSRDQIVDMIRVFLPTSSNEVRLVVELGFLRPVSGHADTYEVRRILKAFVDAQWLSDFDARLAEYAAELEPDAGGGS